MHVTSCQHSCYRSDHLSVLSHLSWLQYIAKPCESAASAFRWHRDNEWMPQPQQEKCDPDYISVWVALDDMTEGEHEFC